MTGMGRWMGEKLTIEGLRLRLAEDADIVPLLDLYVHLSSDNTRCPDEVARDSLRRISQIQGSGVFVGYANGKLVTTCTLIVVPNLTRGGRPYAVIENVVTHPEYRKRGLGKAILDAACDSAWESGCYKVMLSTGSTRPAILSFYESAGFEQSRTGFQKRRMTMRDD